MSEAGQFALIGAGSLGVLWLGWKMRAFGGAAADRDRNPINYWMSFALLGLIAVGSFAIAISKTIAGR